MADSTLNKLIQLIAAPDSAEVRQAAIKVSGVVASARERGLVKALLGALAESDAIVRIEAAEALGRLQAEEALPQLA